MKMAVTYRSEQKKIIKSQLNIVQKTLEVLDHIKETLTSDYLSSDTNKQNIAFTELLMRATEHEIVWK